MTVTTNVPCGNGRVLKATPELIEVELIAYSKSPRYVYFEITGIETPRSQQIVLRPDSLFQPRAFPYKRFAEVWVRQNKNGEWRAVKECEKTPEAVRFSIDLCPGESYFISTEPPRLYTETTQELAALHHAMPESTALHCLGSSIEGRPLFLLRITSPGNLCAPGEERVPVVHIARGEHATEFSGEEIGRGMLALVTSPAGASLRERFLFDFILNTNPDGNFHGWHQYNANDWAAHSYAERVDRSWHHEFVPYLAGIAGNYSPETVALMERMRRTRPAFYISMHSWEGHEGHPGAFYTAEKDLAAPEAEAIAALNAIACEAAIERGYEFHAFPSSNTGPVPHLGPFLMSNAMSLAYLPEGNYAIGRAALQDLGATLLQRCLNDDRIEISAYGGSQWEKLSKQKLLATG